MGNSCVGGRSVRCSRRRRSGSDVGESSRRSLNSWTEAAAADGGRRLQSSSLSFRFGDRGNMSEREAMRLTVRFIVCHYDRVDNDALNNFALYQLHSFSDGDGGLLTLIDLLIQEVPLEHSLGACIIGIVLDSACLPDKQQISELVQRLNLGDAHRLTDAQQKNSLCVLAAYAERLAGRLAECLLTEDVLRFLHSRLAQAARLGERRLGAGDAKRAEAFAHDCCGQLQVACSALIAFQAFVLTDANRIRLVQDTRCCPSFGFLLRQLERWLLAAEAGLVRQVGGLALLLLENYFPRQRPRLPLDSPGRNAILSCSDSTESVKIFPDGLEARSDSSGFESVRCTFACGPGAWYYEVTLVTDGIMQIGWVSQHSRFLSHEGVGVGDDDLSVGIDGCRRCVWTRGAGSEQLYTWRRWRCGDTIGCWLDAGSGLASFCLNGDWLPACARLAGRRRHGERLLFYPAASLMANQHCRFGFGHRPLRHRPPGAESINSQATLTPTQRLVLPWTTRMRLARQRLLAHDYSRLCAICADRPAAVQLLPCRHSGLCLLCSTVLTDCPYCRTAIAATAAHAASAAD